MSLIFTLQKSASPCSEKENSIGLPNTLKVGLEILSGLCLDDVRVHYNSSRPAQVQALAYAQGSDIYLGPGQERHMPHEAWHVVQQKQGRVLPTMQVGEVAINSDERLEREADIMGQEALQVGADSLRGKKGLRSDLVEYGWSSTPSSFLGTAIRQMGLSEQDADGVVGRVPALLLDIPVIQRVTVARTRVDLLGGQETDPFEDQVILQIYHERLSMPQAVKNAVDNFGDCPAAGAYKHHVPYAVIRARILNHLENQDRSTIVEWMTECLEAIGVDPATIGVPDPMRSKAAFDTWLDGAIVAVCDWPQNIFRGPSTGDAAGTQLDTPTAPSAALTNRLAGAVAVLNGLRFWP